MSPDCYACRHNEDAETGSRAEAILVQDGWRVAHAFDTSLPGWLVLLPMRHVTAVEDLSPTEASAMGELIRRCSLALREATGCSKSYFMFFAEAEGFAHLHVHVVPRMDWFGAEQRGPAVFSMLGLPEAQSLPVATREALAESLRAALLT